jgi:hypothetical protein
LYGAKFAIDKGAILVQAAGKNKQPLAAHSSLVQDCLQDCLFARVAGRFLRARKKQAAELSAKEKDGPEAVF